MKQIEGVIDHYLKMDTNYALLISGEWGSGKTYFLKNTLQANISITNTYNDSSKTYKPVIISLFGLKSIEEVQLEILLEIYSILKNSKIKIGADVLKLLAKGYMYTKGLVGFDKLIDQTNTKIFQKYIKINFDEIVICFDDLERINKDLHLEELVGFINNLVENENIKILIFANENEIKNENYHTLKEKIIGNSIEFTPDVENTYLSIIKNKFKGSQLYSEFLTSNQKFILDIYTEQSANFRGLIYTLKYFEIIFSEINNQLFQKENLKDKKEEILLKLLKFTLTISIEYLKGNISYKTRIDLDLKPEFNWKFNFERAIQKMESSNEESTKTEKELFIEKYYIDDDFYFFKSVYDYITGGTVFKYSDLITELNTVFNISDNIIEEHYEVFNKLSYNTCFDLTDEEYLVQTKRMIEYAIDGKYEFIHYPQIFHFIFRFENSLDLDKNVIKNQLIEGIKKSKLNSKYIDSLEFHIRIPKDTENSEYYQEIYEICNLLNDELLKDNVDNKLKEIEKLYYKDFYEFKEITLDTNKEYFYMSFFMNFDVDRFYSFYLKSDASIKNQINIYFENRYRGSGNIKLKYDIDFLNNLVVLIEGKNNELLGKNIQGFIINRFYICLNEIIQKIKNYGISV